ncbi:symmetrical bis(5'-nucleosyl)-tetraphosphatase [Solimonas sp. K1W22B-7]|uniref:symmetrical bis(5'-nucleosyl)-tetraphosphatase n=1 Tax=Solimonas sp. K1W22B-7 TaxID=2303331 RepID=UPI000E32F820|nr:symmetrical bis(5'-nucleosyl)-tetraphosphatase [Solimonas sp. K1W22B-7]AXQ30773.1 symmetrical bis(5'-nucleosyl)-tetraphosphatase [Solimonas sp. K1W22B-7]
MTTYAIGDVQGCHSELCQLLERLRFDPVRDRLILVGDLVNRGPQSLQVLRLVRSLGDRAVTVLGNHDLHLLAVAQRQEDVSPKDTFQDVMQAPDRAELLSWLGQCPLAWEDPDSGTLVVHAGIPPQWDRAQLLDLAAEAGAWIAGPEAGRFYAHMYGNKPDLWDDGLKGWDRIRFIVNSLTRMRYVTPAGRIDTKAKGAPGSQPKGLKPWFEVEGRRTAQDRVIFGHWSTLGRVSWQKGRVWGLDTGCVWGGKLTAMNVETGELMGCDCPQQRKPG